MKIFLNKKKECIQKDTCSYKFASLNNINTHLWNPKKKLGIISTGKLFQILLIHYQFWGFRKTAKDLGIHLLKIGMSWPLDTRKIESFAADSMKF